MSLSRNVKFAPRALADFDAIADYSLDQWGAAQVRTYLDQLLKAINNFARFPGIGAERRNFEAGLYSFPTHEHVVFYRFTDQDLVVRRILHKRQLPDSLDFE